MDNSDEEKLDDFESKVQTMADQLKNPEMPMRDFHLKRTIRGYLKHSEMLDDRPPAKNSGHVKEYYKVPGGYVVEYMSEKATFKDAPFTWFTKDKSGAWANICGSHYYDSFITAYSALVDYSEDIYGLAEAVRIAYAGAKALKGE